MSAEADNLRVRPVREASKLRAAFLVRHAAALFGMGYGNRHILEAMHAGNDSEGSENQDEDKPGFKPDAVFNGTEGLLLYLRFLARPIERE